MLEKTARRGCVVDCFQVAFLQQNKIKTNKQKRSKKKQSSLVGVQLDFCQEKRKERLSQIHEYILVQRDDFCAFLEQKSIITKIQYYLNF